MNSTLERKSDGGSCGCSALLGACVGMTIGALIGNTIIALTDTDSKGWVACLFVQIATTWIIYLGAAKRKAPNESSSATGCENQ